MIHVKHAALCAVLTLCLTPSAIGQDSTCTRRTVVANVLTKDGYPVPGIEPSRLRGEFRGKPARILSVTPDEGPRRIVIVLDASSSMLQPKEKWQLAREVAGEILRASPPKSPLALVIFGSTVDASIDFSQDRKAIVEALTVIAPGRVAFDPKKGRRTALFDTLVEVAEHMGLDTGDVIFVVSDGGEGGGKNSADKVGKVLLSRNLRLFVFLIDEASPFRSRTPEELAGLSAVFKLASATAGGLISTERTMLNAVERAWVVLGLRRQMKQIGFFYRIEVEFARSVDKPREWKLELLPPAGAKKSDLDLVYQRKLLPCFATPSPK